MSSLLKIGWLWCQIPDSYFRTSKLDPILQLALNDEFSFPLKIGIPILAIIGSNFGIKVYANNLVSHSKLD